MRKFRKLGVVLILIACNAVIHNPVFAQQDKLEAEVNQIMKEYEAVGMSVAVVKDGKMVYTRSFGLKNKETQATLNGDDVFRIASISKSFTATALMQLVQKRKFSLDDDFSNLVGFKVRNPKFPNTVITLRMILSHTSSVNDSQGYFNFDVINPEKNTDWAKCYNDYEPGTGYQYCNLNFNMAGAVIERFTGKRFDQYIKQQILDPLKVYGGYCVDSLDQSRFVPLYDYNSKSKFFTVSPAAYAPRTEELSRYVLGYSTPILSPTGGMKISAAGLANYMTMHMNYGKYAGGRIISKKNAKMMQTKLSNEENYGLALLTTDKIISGKTLTGHTGSAYGLYSAMFFQPEDKFGFVVITNGCIPVYENGFNKLLVATMNSLFNNIIQDH